MLNIYSEDFDIKKIADSGQCFRLNPVNDGTWSVLALDKLAFAYKDPNENKIVIDCPEEENTFWTQYFDLDTDYKKFRESVDENDMFLSEAVEFGKGIRILKQDPWEMLITFIISQRRSIPSIKTCVEKLCRNFGSHIKDGFYAFPSPEQLEKATMEELSFCGLGYRAEYVYLAAKKVALRDVDLKDFNSLSDTELMDALLSFRGVGPKVANCVSLFGYHRIDAFPIDVWIDRMLKEYYNGVFPLLKYHGYAGIMQQYIFYFARKK